MIASTASIVETALAGAEVWNPEVVPCADRWVADNFALSTEYEAGGGSFEIEPSMPWWREPLQMLDDRECEEIDILKSTQVGGTLFLMAGILSRARIDPAPAMLGCPDWLEARKIRNRIYGNAQVSSLEIQEMIPPERLWNMLALDLGTMLCHLGWSGGKQSLRGKPCKTVWGTEVDAFEFSNTSGDPIESMRQRVGRFADSKCVFESTPIGEGSRIASMYAESDRRTWQCPCPHCGLFQTLRFFTLRHGALRGRGGVVGYSKPTGFLDPDKAIDAAYYVCLDGCKVESHDKNWMVRNGVWVPKGCKIEERRPMKQKRRRKTIGGDGASLPPVNVVGDPLRSKRVVGYHLWSILNPKISFGHVAANYITHRRSGRLADFYQNWLGLAFRTPNKLPSWKRIGFKLAGHHRRGHVPAPVWFLTAGCDVQQDRVYWIVRGWAPERTSWLIDYGCFRRQQGRGKSGQSYPIIGSDIEQIDQIWGRTFPVIGGANPWGQSQLRVALIGVDSNYHPLQVHEYVRTKDPDEVRCVRGDDAVGLAAKFRSSVVERNERTGEAYEGGMIQWGIYVSGYKDDLAPRLLGPVHESGSFHLLPDMAQDPLGKFYLRQMVNEEKIELPDGRRRWKLKSNSLRKDFRDCELYAAAMADMVVGEIGWGETDWQQYLTATLSVDESTPVKRRDPRDFSAR